jgi:hypothetical protein
MSESAATPFRYPLHSRTSVLECPVHGCAVALNAEGRISSKCPECVRETRRGRDKLRRAKK